MKTSEHRKGVLALIWLAFIFAAMGLFVRYLSTGFLLFQQVYLRVLAAVVLGLFAFRTQLRWDKIRRVSVREWLLIFFRATSNYLFGVTLFSQAILWTKYSNVSFIGALPMTALYGFILFREKITWQKLLLVLVAFIGVVMISVKDYSQIFVWGRGEIAAFISTVFFSLGYVARKWHSKLLNNHEITELIFIIAFGLVFVTSLTSGESLPLSGWTWGLLLAVLGAGFFNVLNLFLINYGFEHVEAVLASNILTLELVFAIGLGFLFFRELPNLPELIGGTVIVASVIGMNREEAKEQKSRQQASSEYF